MASAFLILREIKNGHIKFFGFDTILDLVAFCAYHGLLLPCYEEENSSPRAKDFRS